MRLQDFFLWTFILMSFAMNVNGEDLYELLGQSRQATTVEIRKAFKKLALTMHPDKNRDDPSAHEKFLKINRAYEVLKDEDLRKRYDKFGEEGLKEGGPSGGGYQSWNFYNQQFGIYDDDEEIITLSRSDFDISVEGTSYVWFINFYSPHCSHCHDLAPTWREVAQELVGVVRIGAVNCEDDWHLCRQKGIRSYPTLLLYPEREKFYGTKSKQELVKFVLDHVRSNVVELWSGNFREMTTDPKNSLPWLISFCRSDSGECLESATMIKLSSMLDELAHVATMFCRNGDHICNEIGIWEGLFFFEKSKVMKNEGLEITSYDAREIAYSVLAQLPDVTMLDEQGFEQALQEVMEGVTPAWLIHFVEGEFKDLELRKLPSLVESVKIGRLDCKMYSEKCHSLHIIKFPVFLLFKSIGGHEIHYGRQTAHDIAAFAKDSYLTPVRTLGPQDFPAVTHDHYPWFIDFFAPWCPPCMRLLPEFRKASKIVDGFVKFGTVDCTIHSSLCNSYSIKSYPTTILYNQTKPHHYHGGHHSSEIAEFVQDILKPTVMILIPDSFQLLVTSRSLEETWLVDFYAPWCGPCQQLAPEWRKLAKMLSDMKNVKVGQVDCQEHRSLCQSLNVQSYPSIRLYPRGRTDNAIFHVYNGWYRDAQSIRAWAFEFLPSKTHKLNDNNFESKVFKSPKPWVIDFYAPWCGHCQVFAPEFERVASELRGKVRAGKVNCDESPKLCQRAGVQAYPSVRFYQAGTDSSDYSQNYYGSDINSQDANYIIDYLSKMVPVKAKDTLKKDEL